MNAESGEAVQALGEAAERLERIAAELNDPTTDDARAVELAREAAQLAADAGVSAADAARAAARRGAESD